MINEIECKSILNRSRIPGIDYSINPYTGCQHGCIYCYARFMTRYTKHQMEWGRFCDVKINALDVLKKQISKSRKGLVSLSTVTDPYQSVEKKYELTRNILIELAANGFPVSILTKSPLVLRDIDILKRFDSSECEVGFSIATVEETIRKHFEPGAPAISRRIESLHELHRNGIRTWLFIAPVLPHLTKRSLHELLDRIKDAVNYILVDTLNIKCGNWKGISTVLRADYPTLSSKWNDILFSHQKKEAYYEDVYGLIAEFCRAHALEVKCC